MNSGQGQDTIAEGAMSKILEDSFALLVLGSDLVFRGPYIQARAVVLMATC